MSMMQTAPCLPARARRKDGVIGLWGRLIHRDRRDYEAWLQERDMIAITATLLRLKERQLNRIGLSRATLAFDVEDLALRAEREAKITSDILRLVEQEDATIERREHHAIAAE